MQKTKLSFRQHSRLSALVEIGDEGIYAGCTEPTMCALERRGLAEWKLVGRLERWFATQAGIDFIKSVAIIILLLIYSTAFSAEYTKIELYPPNVGVFTVKPEQQFVAFGVKEDGTKENITTDVDWYTSAPEIVSINEVGKATVHKDHGQVMVTACYPKPCKPLNMKVIVPIISWILLMERTTEEMWTFIYHLPPKYQELWFGKDSNAVIYQDWSEMRGLR